MNILEKIKNKREELKISRKEIAESLNLEQTTYRDIENGKIRLSLENFLIICKKLELSPINLLVDNNEQYILINKQDLDNIDAIIKTLNKIKNQANTNHITIGDNNNIQIGNNINYKK